MQESLKLPASLFKTGLHNHTYHCNLLLHAYAKNGALSHANDLLLLMPSPNLVSYNTLLSGYVRHHRIDHALDLSDSMPQLDALSWNTIISGLVRTQRPEEAISHFIRMTRSPIRPDNYTFASIVPCSDLGLGQQMHGQIVRLCSVTDAFISTNLVKMYAEAGEIDDAGKVFEEMPERDLVSWNVLVSCYSKFGMGDCCLRLFRRMIRDGWRLDEFTYAIVLNGFASRLQFFEGLQVHSLLVRLGLGSYRFTSNALLDLYSKCGFLASAAKLFCELSEKDVVSWTVLITGFAANGYKNYVLEAFHWMRTSEVEPNSFSFGSLISSLASTNAFDNGKRFHGLSLKFGLECDVVVGSALVDMYSKCGDMNAALRLFKNLPERDLVSWNGIICGLAQNGEASMALKIFDEMVQLHQTGLAPNNVTFVGVLSACSHGGFVHQGRRYFSDMFHKYSIKPQTEHYACMVDLMARAGLLDEAETIILSLPFKPDVVMWSTLLGACRRHGNLVMAKRVAERLFLDEPTNSSSYVLLGNIYTSRSEWDHASEVREAICAHRSKKVTGNSWIEIRGEAYSFAAGYTSHPQIGLVYEVLHRLWIQMLDEWYDCGLIQ